MLQPSMPTPTVQQLACVVVVGCMAIMPACFAQFNYIVGPKSYSDVIRPPSGSSSLTFNVTDSLQQLERALQSPVDQLPGRVLLQATRFDKPYNICVSDWLPMVRRKPGHAAVCAVFSTCYLHVPHALLVTCCTQVSVLQSLCTITWVCN